MNTLEESLALAKAWLDSVDDKMFYKEYEQIKQYSNIGPTVGSFIKDSPSVEIVSKGLYIKLFNSNASLHINNFNLIISAEYSLMSVVANDEDYSLAA